MKNLFIVAALCGSVALAGCASTGVTPVPGPRPITTGNINIGATISAAEAAAVKACGFLPTEQTITSILATFVPSTAVPISIGNQIASMICNAVVPKASSRRRLSMPIVNGVRIQGSFVSK